jgi:hypothetical protein
MARNRSVIGFGVAVGYISGIAGKRPNSDKARTAQVHAK